MLIRLKGGTVYDPANGIDGVRMDLYVRNGSIVSRPAPGVRPDQEYDLSGQVVMAGAIDIHTHIGGGKVNIARMLLPEDHDAHRAGGTPHRRSGSGHVTPTTFLTGYRYAEMGYTACFEPAMLPANARQAHLEMADIPIVDAGAYVLLGSDDFLLGQLRSGCGQSLVNDYVAWIVNATHAMGVKVVNPGGISAFKFNQRKLDLDEPHAYYGVTPRQILQVLCAATSRLGIPHPLHVHGCNLGIPGNVETTLATIDAVAGLPVHLTHLQFHSYGTEGDRHFSSGAPRLAEKLANAPNVSIDVGQIMFGQTVTASGDTMLQYQGRMHASPRKTVIMDIECDAGCGVVPFRYRNRNFVNALQWCIGLELFLLVEDPWRVFMTTDHPNGAPFTFYPHLVRLLMDRQFRNDVLQTIHPGARQHSILESITREYSLYEIAILTRAAPARSLGLSDRGHLGTGAAADIVAYRPRKNYEQMFASPEYVFKDGTLVVRKGRIVESRPGSIHAVKPGFDRNIVTRIKRYFDEYHTVRAGNFVMHDDEVLEYGRSALNIHPCSRT